MKVEISVVTLQEIFEVFDKAGVVLGYSNHDALTQMYGHELSTMLGYVKYAVEPCITMLLPHKAYLDYIIDFNVSCLSKPKKDTFNWHLQNMSQVIYNGAIVYDTKDQTISSHH